MANPILRKLNRISVSILSLKSDAGFTILEMLLAFTILAVVSGSLFQVFYVSDRNNKIAADYDAANNIAITAAELFKANPDRSAAELFKANPGRNAPDCFGGGRDAAPGDALYNAKGECFIKYYDSSWRELDVSSPDYAAGATAGATADAMAGAAFDARADAPKDAAFIMEARFDETTGGDTDENNSSAAMSLALDSTQEYRLVISEEADAITAYFNGVQMKIDSSKIGRSIPVNIEYRQEGILPKHITAYNQTGLTVNVDIFGVPGAGEDMRRKYVEVSAAAGSIGVMYFDDRERPGDSVLRTLEITVSRLSGDSPALAHVRAARYLPA